MTTEGILYPIYEYFLDDAASFSIQSSPAQRTNSTTAPTAGSRFNDSQDNDTASSTQEEGQNENNGGTNEGNSSSTSAQSTNNEHVVPFFDTGILILFHFIVGRLKQYSRHYVKKKSHEKKRNENTDATRDMESIESIESEALTVYQRGILRGTVCERRRPQGRTIPANSLTQGNYHSDENIPLSSPSTASSTWSLRQNAFNNTSSSVQNDNMGSRSTSSNDQVGRRRFGSAIFLHGFMRLSMSLGIFLLFVLYLFNHTYIGSKMTSDTPTCLQTIISRYHDQDTMIPTKKFLKHDEILQINILDGGPEHYCKKHECSKAWEVGTHVYVDLANAQDTEFDSSLEQTLLSPTTWWEKPFYRFALKEELLSMSKNDKIRRNVKEINVTVTPHCLTTGHDLAKHPSLTTRIAEKFLSFLSSFTIYDTVMLNEVVHSSRTENGEYQDGYLMNEFTRTKWSWSGQHLNRSFRSTSTIDKICKKISILLFSLASFFVITSITAILTHSITTFLHCFLQLLPKQSFMGLVKNRVLLAHLAKFGITYWMYNASKDYLKFTISERQEYTYCFYSTISFFIYVDVFRLVFVRSALSIAFFPKIVLLYYLCFSIYLNSTPFGFFSLATEAWRAFIIHSMLFCILALEVPAFLRGRVSQEDPREVYSKIQSSDQSMNDFSSEWSLFYPLNSRYVPLGEDRDT